MLRITRLVKKDCLFDLFKDKNVSSLKLYSSLNNSLKDLTVAKVDIYLRIPKEEFFRALNQYESKGASSKNNCVVTTVSCARRDGFLKESAFSDFGSDYTPSKTMQLFMKAYNQQYFWDLQKL